MGVAAAPLPLPTSTGTRQHAAPQAAPPAGIKPPAAKVLLCTTKFQVAFTEVAQKRCFVHKRGPLAQRTLRAVHHLQAWMLLTPASPLAAKGSSPPCHKAPGGCRGNTQALSGVVEPPPESHPLACSQAKPTRGDQHTHPQLYRFLQPNTRHSRRACQPLFADLPPLSSCSTWWATVRYGKMNRVGLGPDPAKGLFLETHIPGGDRHVHGQESVRLAVHTGQSPAPHHSLRLQHCAHDKPEQPPAWSSAWSSHEEDG